jgi:N6-adenosine-specific RNA methylase IME4/ParB-like chromosome segregation protein Spo0J
MTVNTHIEQINILPELQSLIPPLKSDEFAQLEKNCIEHGITDPLVIAVWPDKNSEERTAIGDGHNRYEIAKKNGLTFKTVRREFESLDMVKVWMIDNQKGRRNLSDFVKIELQEVKRKILKDIGRELQAEYYGNQHDIRSGLLSLNDKSPKPKHDTRKEIAKDLGFSTGKVGMAHVIINEADEETKEKLRNGDLSITAAYKKIKTKDRREQQKAIKEEKLAQPISKRKYGVIYCDPPWKYDFSTTSNRDIENQYPTMTISELKDIEIPCEDNAVLLMWSTAPKLKESLDLMEHWGFEYKTNSVWDKEIIGMGYWFRGQHEFLLVGVKGKFSPPETENRYSSVYKERRTRHSKKPDYYYDMINKMFPNYLKLEMFARDKHDGFDNWGNENL